MIKFYTANYANCNNNFVIQNIAKKDSLTSDTSTISVLKNILQRGAPTLPSFDLKQKIDPKGLLNRKNRFRPLIDLEPPVWRKTIKGPAGLSDNLAEKFFNTLIPKYLADYSFINQLICPEVLINNITQIEDDEFYDQKVDFYLPLARLVIEIDGKQHEKTIREDKNRDNYLYKQLSIKTIRIKNIIKR